MPFRNAHYWLLPLVPMVVLAFWPGYFGMLREAPFALHAHGIAASLWLILVWLQAWTTSKNRLALHRVTGLAMFVAVPLFVAGSLLAMQGVVTLAAAKSDPFHITYGPRLMLADGTSIVAFLILTTIAIRHRRQVWTHAGAMLATVILVLPPIVGRLPLLPRRPIWGMAHTTAALELGQMSGVVLAAVLAFLYPRSRKPFGFVAIVIAAESLAYETFGRTAAWDAIIFRLIGVPPIGLALAGLVIGAVPLWWAWRRGASKVLRADALVKAEAMAEPV